MEGLTLSGNLWDSLGAVEEGHDLGSRADGVRAEQLLAGALGDLLIHGPEDRLEVERLVVLHVVKAERLNHRFLREA